MNVVSKTPNLLKLRERPIGIWLISAFTALLGMLIFISFDSPIDYFGLSCIGSSNLMMFGSPVQTCIFNKDLNYVTQIPSTDWKLQKKLAQYIRQFLSSSSEWSQTT